MWQQLFDCDMKCIFSISPLKAWHLLLKTSISVKHTEQLRKSHNLQRHQNIPKYSSQYCNTSKYLTLEINKGETHNTGVSVMISSFECTTWPIRNNLNIIKLTFPFRILSSLKIISSFFHLVLLSVQSDRAHEIMRFFLN